MAKEVLSFIEHKQESDYFKSLKKISPNYVTSDQGEKFRKVNDTWYSESDSLGEDQQLCQDFGKKLDSVQQKFLKK